MSDFDSEEFQEVLVLELTERIEELNKGLLILEKNPTNKNAYNELMRTLHNLKGLFSLSGYQQLSSLTHSMENIVENHESREVGKVLKVIFDFSSELSRFSQIMKSGKGQDLVRFDSLTQQLASFKEMIVSLGNDFRIRVLFSPDCKIVSSRSLTLINKLKKIASITKISPLIEEIENGLSFQELILEITTKEEENQIVCICEESKDVLSVKISHVLYPISTKPVVIKDQDLHELLTVRVNIKDLNNLIQLLDDIVIYTKFLREIIETQNVSRTYRANLENFERTISNIQELANRMRIVPLETILNRFPRMVYDLAYIEGKKIDFFMTGKHIGVDRSIVNQLLDPITHLLRNAISHGIELPNDRKKVNKDPVGVINLSASHEISNIVIEIRDDGRGLNYEAIQKKLIKAKIIEPNIELTPSQIHNYLLTVGISTVNETTEISGRGVGLTAVKRVMDSIGGKIDILSKLGMGTTFRLSIPLSAEIM
ncbi:chemotaxis protein CheA [Candidatus Hodarchaeum mangrovi]